MASNLRRCFKSVTSRQSDAPSGAEDHASEDSTVPQSDSPAAAHEESAARCEMAPDEV